MSDEWASNVQPDDELNNDALQDDGVQHSEDESDVAGEQDAQEAYGADKPASTDPMATGDMIHVDRYEGTWMRITVAVIAVFFIAVLISAFAVGFQLPGVYERIDPETLYDPGNPFSDPGLRELAPGKYELYIRAQIWSFTPNEVHVPVGSQVTVYATSADLLHGYKLQNTNLNMMLIPGQVSTLTTTFTKPGTYNFICHEYCGIQHQNMFGKIIVDPLDEVADTTTDVSSASSEATPTQVDNTDTQENIAASEGETD